MYFDESFVKSLPDDWNYAALSISDKFNSLLGILVDKDRYTVVEELCVLLKVLHEIERCPSAPPSLSDRQDSDISMMKNYVEEFAEQAKEYIERQNKKAKLLHYEDVYRISLSKIFHYEFTDGDIKRIQKLTNELRDLISESKEIEEKYKQRLLRKLEKFQSEIHKTVSDLDKTWGFLVEASIYIGQIGKNVKPMVDRIRELVGIIGPTHARAYDLPSNLPIKLLSKAEEEKTEEQKS